MAMTPFAIAHHIQFVDKNAKITDIARRFSNNGRAHAYYYHYKYVKSINIIINTLGFTLNNMIKSHIKLLKVINDPYAFLYYYFNMIFIMKLLSHGVKLLINNSDCLKYE